MTSATVRHRRGVVLLALAGGLLGAGPAKAADPVTLSAGHVDYGVRVVGGVLRSQVKDGTGPTVVWREPGDVRFRLTAAARTTVPSASSFGFLGTAGATTWLIPQTQKADVVWLGWNTEELTSATGATGSVSWSLDEVTGPGRVGVFTTDAFGSPSVIFDSGDGLPDRYAVPLGVHAHGNWGFSAPGTYTLRFTHRATIGGAVQEDTRATTVVVDDVTPGGGNPGGGGGSGPAPAPGGGTGGGAGNAPGAGPTPGGGGGTPGAGGAAPASSSVAVRSRTARMTSGRRVALRVRCGAARGTCRGTVTLTSASRITVAGKRRKARIGRASVVVPAGTTRTVRLRVPKRLAGELRGRRSRSLTVRAAVRATVDGRTRTGTSRVALRVR